MASIGLIAPYKKLYYESLKVKKQFKIDELDVRMGLLSSAADVAKNLIKNGSEIIITRGRTARFIKDQFPELPLVEITISSYDIARAIIQAKRISKKIALITFSDMFYDKLDLSTLFDADIKYIKVEKEEEITESMKDIVKEYNVIVGGFSTFDKAQKMGYHSILIDSGKDSIYQAITQAQNILQYRKDVAKQSELIETVIENTPIGIITTDRDDRIKMINRPALKILKTPQEFVIGKKATSVFPKLDKKRGGLINGFRDDKIVFHVKAMDIFASNIGSIISLEKISDISEKENYIRREFAKKGHFARYNFSDIVGESRAIKNIVEMAKRYAGFDITVLINGETGTGKEMFAQSIHNLSQRRNGPFVAVNCAALSGNLLESELFGYVEGAFTGASKSGKTGLFEMAHKGTIFLDEIAEISPAIQAKLLRVIQEKIIMRLGDDKTIPIDVRIIAATNKDLKAMVENGDFREDLFYRLNVLTLKLPPLKQRTGDVRVLFDYLINNHVYSLKLEKPIIDNNCYQILENHDWPGNIRELDNFCQRLLVASDTGYINAELFSFILGSDNELSEKIKLDDQDIYEALKHNNFNKTKTAQMLGIGRTTLWRRLKDMQDITDINDSKM